MRTSSLVLGLVALASSAQSTPAQGYPFSQRASVTQTAAFTTIQVEYGRPIARGRELYGDSAVVSWGKLWHPGADSATRISFNHDVVVEDKPLAAGEYSLWLIPRNGTPWTLIFNKTARTFHTPYPGEATEALRVQVMPVYLDYAEALSFSFPSVLRDSTVMRIHWGKTSLPVRIVAPFKPAG